MRIKKLGNASICVWRLSLFAILVVTSTMTIERVVVSSAEAQTTNTAKRRVTFKPPPDGAPATRIGGGTRSVQEGENEPLKLLIPEDGAMSANPAPLFIWEMRDPFNGELSLDIIATDQTVPWFKFRETRSWPSGLNGLSLEQFGVALHPGTIYKWKVTLNPSNDGPAASSFVEYKRPEKLVREGDKLALMSEYAQLGYWMDALALGVLLADDGKIKVVEPEGVESLRKSAGLH